MDPDPFFDELGWDLTLRLETGVAVASAVSFVALNLAVFGFLEFRFGISPFSRSTLRSLQSLSSS